MERIQPITKNDILEVPIFDTRTGKYEPMYMKVTGFMRGYRPAMPDKNYTPRRQFAVLVTDCGMKVISPRMSIECNQRSGGYSAYKVTDPQKLKEVAF